jgi:hypothetical protein
LPVTCDVSVYFAIKNTYELGSIEGLLKTLGFTERDLSSISFETDNDFQSNAGSFIEDLESEGLNLDDLKEDYDIIKAYKLYYDSSTWEGGEPDDIYSDKFYTYFFRTESGDYTDFIRERRTIIKDVLILIEGFLDSG